MARCESVRVDAIGAQMLQHPADDRFAGGNVPRQTDDEFSAPLAHEKITPQTKLLHYHLALQRWNVKALGHPAGRTFLCANPAVTDDRHTIFFRDSRFGIRELNHETKQIDSNHFPDNHACPHWEEFPAGRFC